MHPVIDRFRERMNGRAEVVKIDIDSPEGALLTEQIVREWVETEEYSPVGKSLDSIDLAIEMETSWRFCSTGVAMTAIAVFLLSRNSRAPHGSTPPSDAFRR